MRAHKEGSLGHQPFQDISGLSHFKKKKKSWKFYFHLVTK